MTGSKFILPPPINWRIKEEFSPLNDGQCKGSEIWLCPVGAKYSDSVGPTGSSIFKKPGIVCEKFNQTTIIIGDVGNTESDTLCLSRPYVQLTHFGGSDFGVSF